MTTITTLIAARDLEKNFGQYYSHLNIQDYLAYQYRPYIHLNTFSFCEFDGTLDPIIGQHNRILLIGRMNELYNRQKNLVEQLCVTMASSSCLFDLCKHQSNKELFDLLSGRLTINSFFYSFLSNSAFLDPITMKQVLSTPEKYVLADINLHW